MRSVLVFVGVVFVVCTASPTKPVEFNLNLDQPANERWVHIVSKYADLAKEAHKIIASVVPPEALPLIEEIGADLDSYLQKDYADEIRGIAKGINGSLGDVVLVNLAYDLTAFCTSIVCQDNQGRMWHARNLDYSYAEILRPLTIKVNFQKGGKTVYTGITFAGYVGLLTGQRPNGFTITVDERDQGEWWMNILVAILDRTAKPLSFLVRDTVANITTYEAAVTTLSKTDTAADVYFIVGGIRPGEGVVITKSRIGYDDIWHLNQTKTGWYLVETNYDHWTAPPAHDNRRDPAIKAMNSMGQGNIAVTGLFNVLSTPPVLNNHTIYSIVMSAIQPDMLQSWVRHP